MLSAGGRGEPLLRLLFMGGESHVSGGEIWWKPEQGAGAQEAWVPALILPSVGPEALTVLGGGLN